MLHQLPDFHDIVASRLSLYYFCFRGFGRCAPFTHGS